MIFIEVFKFIQPVKEKSVRIVNAENVEASING